ncbi:hypothetical protein Noda2021_12060 [Candidatus Dependentiae bacterium Noda2021]|nr:hypothetical protein Noda2021_12060 [Candidatus Dependentiae bacterium Noda2021]
MKKKIIVLSSSGGAGHVTATQALKDCLSGAYDVTSIDFMHVLHDIDLVKKITRGGLEAEQVFYNYCLKRRWFAVLNIVYQIGTWYFALRRKKITAIFKKYIIDQKADLIISVVPIINGALADAAQMADVPLIIVPTDLNAKSFINGMHKTSYNKICMTQAFDDADVANSIKPSGLISAQIATTGFPLRKQFFNTKEKNELKDSYAIPKNKPIIFLMMGGQGSSTIITFLNELSKIASPFHIIVCIGKFEQLRLKIESLSFPAHITYTIVGFTSHIDDYMAMSDFAITKSGSVSVSESIYMNLPMFFDATGTILTWERFNHAFIKSHGFGQSITSVKCIKQVIENVLAQPSVYQAMHENLAQFPKKIFCDEIPVVVKNLLNS